MANVISNTFPSSDRLAPMAALHVEVIADVVCPFCYIGKRRLDNAMQAVRGPSEINWYPYQLNPDIPATGMSFDEYISRRFGNPANIQPALDRLVKEGREEGIEFRFDKLTLIPNTLPAHQLLQLAETDGRDQTAIAESLLHAFFEEGANISDADLLIDLAGKHNLQADSVRAVLASDQSRQIVLSRESQVRASGMTGLPGYLLNRRLLVVGAQPTDILINAFDRAMFGEGDDAPGSPAVH